MGAGQGFVYDARMPKQQPRPVVERAGNHLLRLLPDASRESNERVGGSAGSRLQVSGCECRSGSGLVTT